jgi:hypothetical protein
VKVFVSTEKGKKELEEEFKKEIELKQLIVVLKKLSGMKQLHHTISEGKDIISHGTVGAIMKARDGAWYGITCAHCFVKYDDLNNDLKTFQSLEASANAYQFKEGPFKLVIDTYDELLIDTSDVLLYCDEYFDAALFPIRIPKDKPISTELIIDLSDFQGQNDGDESLIVFEHEGDMEGSTHSSEASSYDSRAYAVVKRGFETGRTFEHAIQEPN